MHTNIQTQTHMQTHTHYIHTNTQTQTHIQTHARTHKYVFHEIMPKSCLKIYVQKQYLSSQYAEIYTADTGNTRNIYNAVWDWLDAVLNIKIRRGA